MQVKARLCLPNWAIYVLPQVLPSYWETSIFIRFCEGAKAKW